jgi:hypothetical protein
MIIREKLLRIPDTNRSYYEFAIVIEKVIQFHLELPCFSLGYIQFRIIAFSCNLCSSTKYLKSIFIGTKYCK